MNSFVKKNIGNIGKNERIRLKGDDVSNKDLFSS